MIVTFIFHNFLKFPNKVQVLIFLFTFLSLNSGVSRSSKVHNFACSLFFCWLLWCLVFWPGLGDPFVCSIRVYACHFLGHVLGCAYTICLYGRIEISCTFPSGSPCRPCRVSPYTPSVLIFCIHVLCHWSFVVVVVVRIFHVIYISWIPLNPIRSKSQVSSNFLKIVADVIDTGVLMALILPDLQFLQSFI